MDMEFFRLLLLRFIVSFCVVGCGACYLAAQNSAIILGPIEGDLARKQIPIDLGRTPQALVPLISKPIYVHGGLRLAHANESQYSATFSSAGQNDIQVVLSKGNPKAAYLEYRESGSNLEDAVSKACDRLVQELLGIPGFFSGRLCFISDLSGKKEIFVADSLMTYARPQTSFGKITFNPSWNNKGTGIFFTSNRRVFNNLYHLDLGTRRVSTVAEYRGSNLQVVQIQDLLRLR